LRHGVDLLGMLLSKLKLFELVLLKEMVMIQMYDMLQNVHTTIHCVIPLGFILLENVCIVI